MRLLNTSTYELHDSGEPKVAASPEYAILSHRWQLPEVTLQALNPAELRQSRSSFTPQLDKIKQACSIARQRRPQIEWLWLDTCCIDKTNAVEEARAINSMFSWYRQATVCIAYLYDVDISSVTAAQDLFMSNHPDRRQQYSEWFERGWTLQELLAPDNVEFYDSNWTLIGTKMYLADHLELATGISQKYLNGSVRLNSASIATRMSWMAGRTTTMVEDIAYSMLGILQVNMTPLYGEGTNAFIRLQKSLIESSTDESIFAWTTPSNGLRCYRQLGKAVEWAPERWGLLAPSPDCFPKDREVVIIDDKVRPRPRGGYQWTQYGVHFEVHWKPTPWSAISYAYGYPKTVKFPLNCWIFDQDGKRRTIQVYLSRKVDMYHRVRCSELGQSRRAQVDTKRRKTSKTPFVTKPVTVIQPKFDPIY